MGGAAKRWGPAQNGGLAWRGVQSGEGGPDVTGITWSRDGHSAVLVVVVVLLDGTPSPPPTSTPSHALFM